MASTNTNQEKNFNTHCVCGCSSRTMTMWTNSLSTVVGVLLCFNLLLGMIAEKDDFGMQLGVFIFVGIVTIIHALAVWGACTYHRWPVILALGLVSIGMVLGVVSTVVLLAYGDVAGLRRGIIGLWIQYKLFYSPMDNFLDECDRLKALESYDGLETEGDKMKNMEMV